jgi:hypothetical protein
MMMMFLLHTAVKAYPYNVLDIIPDLNRYKASDEDNKVSKEISI